MSSYKSSVRKFDLPVERFGKITLEYLDQLNNVQKNVVKVGNLFRCTLIS